MQTERRLGILVGLSSAKKPTLSRAVAEIRTVWGKKWAKMWETHEL